MTNHTLDRDKEIRAIRAQVDEANGLLQRIHSPETTRQIHERRNILLDDIARLERLDGAELDAKYKARPSTAQPLLPIPTEEQNRARLARQQAIQDAVMSQSAASMAQDAVRHLRKEMERELADAATGDLVAIATRYAELIDQAEREVEAAIEHRTYSPY